MITCRKLIKFLDDYVAGALPEPVRRRFESHLEACPMCRLYLESYRATIELERAALRCGQGGESAKPAEAKPEPMPEALVEAILKASRESEAGPSSEHTEAGD